MRTGVDPRADVTPGGLVRGRLLLTELARPGTRFDTPPCPSHHELMPSPGGNCFDLVSDRILAKLAAPAGATAHLTFPYPVLA